MTLEFILILFALAATGCYMSHCFNEYHRSLAKWKSQRLAQHALEIIYKDRG